MKFISAKETPIVWNETYFLFLANAIETSEYMDNSEITSMCGKLSDVLTAF